MSTHDILPGKQEVECWWREMRNIPYGSEVPRVKGEFTYSIALREGGFAEIVNCKFVGIFPKSSVVKVFDKWGFAMDKIPEGYLFKT